MRLRNNLDEVRSAPEWSKEFEAFTKRYTYEEDFYVLHMDGIIDMQKWKQSGSKIMLFLRASWEGDYGGRNYIHPQILRLKEAKYEELSYSFHIMNGWIEAVEEGLFALPKTEECRLQSTALVNVSKYGDEVTYNHCAAESGIVYDGALLYRQIKAIAPKVVLCANTARYYFELMRRAEETNFDLSEELSERTTRDYISRRVKTLYETERGGEKLAIYEHDGVLIFETASPAARGKYATKPETILTAIHAVKGETKESA